MLSPPAVQGVTAVIVLQLLALRIKSGCSK